jgi:hypothetical protein
VRADNAQRAGTPTHLQAVLAGGLICIVKAAFQIIKTLFYFLLK